MGNRIFKQLVESEMKKFKGAFSDDSYSLFFDENQKKLIHSAEFGAHREKICRNFLQLFTPPRLGISTGFVMTHNDLVSTQCDLIIYDQQHSVFIKSDDQQRFFPVETVVGIGEVKSNLSKKDFKSALVKLAKNKELREDIPDGCLATNTQNFRVYKQTEQILGDHLMSFLICNKLQFKLSELSEIIETAYKDIHINYRHNLILSLNDGLIVYENGTRCFAYPQDLNFEPLTSGTSTPVTKMHFEPVSQDDPENHLKRFAQQFYITINNVASFYPPIEKYLDFPLG